MKIGRQRMRLGLACLALIVVAAHSGYAYTHVSARDLAAELSLDIEVFDNPDDGTVGGCALSGNGSRVTLLVGLKMARVNGDRISSYREIEASGKDVMIPDEIASAIRRRMGAAPKRDGRFTVVIDPGHGGHDPGAIGGQGAREKDVVLAVSLLLADMLRKEGVNVVMTRAEDVFIPPDDRVQTANRAGADLFVSIHANAAENSSASGFEIYVPADSWDNPSIGNISQRAAQAADDSSMNIKGVEMAGMSRSARITLLTALFEEHRRLSHEAAGDIRASLKKHTNANDRGTIEDRRGLRVLRNTCAPAALVELDFLSNPAVERRLTSRQYQTTLARALSEGIISYMRRHGSPGR